MKISEYENIIKNPTLVDLPLDTRFFLSKNEANSYYLTESKKAFFSCKIIYMYNDTKNEPNNKGQYTFSFDGSEVPIYCVSFSKLKSEKFINMDDKGTNILLPLNSDGLLDDNGHIRVTYKDTNGFCIGFSDKMMYCNGSQMDKIKTQLKSAETHIKFDEIITKGYIKTIKKTIFAKKIDIDKISYLTGFSLKSLNSFINDNINTKFSKYQYETIINALNTIHGI